ncbi:SDR family NAD(P)-dependent oxidoreductase [Rhodococcus opacus]|uniref:SDR family NAD(P)-dependent oxidoreductase n=1 Tax=Rhodococcus opacus TaxID=37919 RepID=UPI00160168F6|nr:SDR family NAD(P)-dependent oxidoreductase [Rhodococcus opacus]QZS52730.1 SDR family oxidoreductase [Rhodococcus opacus]
MADQTSPRQGRLAGKVAVITGAASAAGLGFATAKLFVQEGASVIITDIATSLKDRLADFPEGSQVEAIQHNVQEESEWIAVFDQARERFGSVDILVNNAGITRRSPIDEMDYETYRQVVDTNLTGTWLGCKHAVIEMKRSGKGGAIVNVASISGIVGMRYSSPYGSSKGGIRTLTKVVALETAHDGIRCNAVCPGIINSDIVAPVEKQSPAAFKVLLDGIPMGKLGQSEDIANAALYLASDDAKYVTGAELAVDGGYTAQ